MQVVKKTNPGVIGEKKKKNEHPEIITAKQKDFLQKQCIRNALFIKV